MFRRVSHVVNCVCARDDEISAHINVLLAILRHHRFFLMKPTYNLKAKNTYENMKIWHKSTGVYP